jgi:hypothetical protein
MGILTVTLKPPAGIVAMSTVWSILVLLATAIVIKATDDDAAATWLFAVLGAGGAILPLALATYVSTEQELTARNLFVILRKQELITNELTNEMDEMVESRDREANVPHDFEREISRLKELDLFDMTYKHPVEINRSELAIGQKLGSGSFGEVLQARCGARVFGQGVSVCGCC